MPYSIRTIMRTAFFLSIIAILFIQGAVIATAEDWSSWKHRMPITLTGRQADTAGLVPVDVTFSLFADQCTKPEREIRLVSAEGDMKEVPFQLSGVTKWTKDTDGNRSLPTVNGMITFFDEAPSGAYILLYGNPNATAPTYPTDLKVTGSKPGWTVDNGVMTVDFRGKSSELPESTNHDSGQLAKVTLKSRPDAPFTSHYGMLHWNPGIFVPARGWMHSFAWDPPEVCEIEQGPLFVKITRSGIFPDIPEVHLAITYRIFTNRDYVESGTVMTINDDIGVVALRNNQLVFEANMFTKIAWSENGKSIDKSLDIYKPVNSHGDILRLSDRIDYIALANPATGIGVASVIVDYNNVGPGGAPPTLFDNATYVSNGGHALTYFFRPLIYFHVGWDRKQLITVPKGSVYSERNLYHFYDAGSGDTFGAVVMLSKAVNNMPGIRIGDGGFPPEK
ncbi:hypothetical protein ACFL47_03225 [Candidatus Latescibacterota bacterium]